MVCRLASPCGRGLTINITTILYHHHHHVWMRTSLLLSLDTKDWNVLFLFTDFYMYIVFMCCVILNVVGLYLFYLRIFLAFQAEHHHFNLGFVPTSSVLGILESSYFTGQVLFMSPNQQSQNTMYGQIKHQTRSRYTPHEQDQYSPR